MKINASPTKVICCNRNGLHNYFGWPTVGKLKNGKLAMVASGFRVVHVCPFGKGVMCVSEDEGETWTKPAVIIDTPLDDRDCGIVSFGESSVLVTSFNNPIEFQRWNNDLKKDNVNAKIYDYVKEYLNFSEASGKEDDYMGSYYIISNDNGVTWSDLIRIPITSPHGPCDLGDGTLLYVGMVSKYGKEKYYLDPNYQTQIQCYRIYPDGKHEYICSIDNVPGVLFCEPHATVLKNGKIVVQLRTQSAWRDAGNVSKIYTTYQCESDDLSKGFTTPHQVLSDQGGAPSHLLELSNGMLISTYCYRNKPNSIKVMFSKDGGKTWDLDNVICEAPAEGGDMGYPSSVELSDGRILTTFYGSIGEGMPTEIMQVVWTYTEE